MGNPCGTGTPYPFPTTPNAVPPGRTRLYPAGDPVAGSCGVPVVILARAGRPVAVVVHSDEGIVSIRVPLPPGLPAPWSSIPPSPSCGRWSRCRPLGGDPVVQTVDPRSTGDTDT